MNDREKQLNNMSSRLASKIDEELTKLIRNKKIKNVLEMYYILGKIRHKLNIIGTNELNLIELNLKNNVSL